MLLDTGMHGKMKSKYKAQKKWGKKNRKHNTNIIYKSILFKISTKRRFPQKFSSVCNINKLGLFGFDNMVHF